MNSRRRLTIAALLLAMPPALQAQIDGPLFTPPEQRAYLDALREQYLARSRNRGFDISEVAIPALPQEQTAAAPRADLIYRLGGIMSLRDGSHSIWLNDRSLREEDLPRSARLVREGSTLVLRFETPRGVAVLRPGQTLNFDRGLVQESYQASSSATDATEAEAMPVPTEPVAQEQDDAR